MPVSEVSLVQGRWEERWIAVLQRQKIMSIFSSLDRKTSKQEIKFPKDFFSVHIMSHLTCYQLAHRESFALGLCLLLLHALLKHLWPHHILLSTDSHSLAWAAICPQSTLVYGFWYKRQVFIWHTVSRKMSCFIHSVYQPLCQVLYVIYKKQTSEGNELQQIKVYYWEREESRKPGLQRSSSCITF